MLDRIIPGFPILVSPGHAPSDNFPMLAEGRVAFQLARRFSRRESGFIGHPDARRPLHGILVLEGIFDKWAPPH